MELPERLVYSLDFILQLKKEIVCSPILECQEKDFFINCGDINCWGKMSSRNKYRKERVSCNKAPQKKKFTPKEVVSNSSTVKITEIETDEPSINAFDQLLQGLNLQQNEEKCETISPQAAVEDPAIQKPIEIEQPETEVKQQIPVINTDPFPNLPIVEEPIQPTPNVEVYVPMKRSQFTELTPMSVLRKLTYIPPRRHSETQIEDPSVKLAGCRELFGDITNDYHYGSSSLYNSELSSAAGIWNSSEPINSSVRYGPSGATIYAHERVSPLSSIGFESNTISNFIHSSSSEKTAQVYKNR